MQITKTDIAGLLVLKQKITHDERGHFRRLYAEDELLSEGVPSKAFHVNSSFSKYSGTLRGIHFQFPPYAETKIVSCVSGSIWDVGVDLRPESPTRFEWFGTELNPTNGISLLIPEGFGHAFITLEPDTSVVYAISTGYSIANESGILFNEPILGIKWPILPKVISSKDSMWPPLQERIDEIDRRFSQ